jgi:hypothetical protein
MNNDKTKILSRWRLRIRPRRPPLTLLCDLTLEAALKA